MLDVDLAIADLELVIGFWPPDIADQEEFDLIEEKYDQTMLELDRLLEGNRDSLKLRVKRGRLHRMGHNFDKDGAWQRAETDLLTVLEMDSENVPAMVEIGLLYVNSELEFAPRAQRYFERAQQIQGEEPHEAAQVGLFFSYYYQGKLKKAREKALLLNEHFPNVEKYQNLLEIIEDVLARPGMDGG